MLSKKVAFVFVAKGESLEMMRDQQSYLGIIAIGSGFYHPLYLTTLHCFVGLSY